ncbi:sortase B protein-sorting domain-containing protein [Pelistega ratti]
MSLFTGISFIFFIYKLKLFIS